jgi:chromosome segregation ATPase
LAGLNIELEKARGQMTKLSAELENKNAENVTLSKKIESYKLVTELADPKAEKTINPESGNLVEVKSQLESLKIDLQKAKNDKKELKANLAKAKNRITELEWDLMDKNEPVKKPLKKKTTFFKR